MSESELGEITPRSFHNKVKGFYEHISDGLTIDRTLIRWQTALLMTSTGNYKKGIRPTDIMSIPEIDKQSKEIELSIEEGKKAVEKYAKIFKDGR